jgi:hypothetical protein
MVSDRLDSKPQIPNPKSQCGHCLGFRTWVLGFGIWVLGCVLAVSAQGRGGARGAAAAPPNQLRQVLYDMADSIGMLRNANEVDRIGSMNYWATGTITSGGQACKVVDYKASVNWILKGMRVDYKCEGSPQRHVEVVRDNLAWNETEPGKGGTAAAAAANERALLLWTLPAGAIKAANDAGAATKVTTENGKTVVSYPIASLKADVKVTLNKDSHIEQVESRMGAVTTVTTYEEYGDWNGADYLSDVMFPKRIVQKRGTMTITDLTITKTNTYNPYVIMPVPDHVKGAR